MKRHREVHVNIAVHSDGEHCPKLHTDKGHHTCSLGTLLNSEGGSRVRKRHRMSMTSAESHVPGRQSSVVPATGEIGHSDSIIT